MVFHLLLYMVAIGYAVIIMGECNAYIGFPLMVLFYLIEVFGDAFMFGGSCKKEPNWQICVCNQQMIDKHLHFVESIELRNDEC